MLIGGLSVVTEKSEKMSSALGFIDRSFFLPFLFDPISNSKERMVIIVRTIIRFLKPHKMLCILTLLLAFIDVFGALIIPTYTAEMMNAATSGSDFHELAILCVKMLITAALSGAAMIVGSYVCAEMTSRVGADMRKALYNKSLELSTSDFRNFGKASLTTRTVSDITNIQLALGNCFQILFPVPIIFVISLVLAYRIDPLLGSILLCVLAIITVVCAVIIRSTSPKFALLQKKLDGMSRVILENITGVRVIRAFNKEDHEDRRLRGEFLSYADMSISVNKRFAVLDSISFFAVNFFIMLVYCLSGARITAGYFEIGDITAIIEYAMLSLFFLMMAQMVILTLPRALECSDRIGKVLEYVPSIADAKGYCEIISTTDAVMSFKNVSFKFDDADEYTLKDLNFECRRGETVAIIGGTGSGKSTVASLMMRFNDVTSGAIELFGVDVREIPQSVLHDRLSFVKQRAWLFSGTVAENLRYGNPNASDDELWHALEIAQARDFIEEMPLGLDSPVAQGGGNFSGGQRQRLSIARALVKKPDLYIFDDSFSALDFKTDAALRAALVPETKDAAVVIIAQRISTILHADKIIVLCDGETVGIGRHEELLENCPVYKEIYDSQTKEVPENE